MSWAELPPPTPPLALPPVSHLVPPIRRGMAGSQREVTVRWSGQLSMKDDFLVVWSAGRVMRVRWGGFLSRLFEAVKMEVRGG